MPPRGSLRWSRWIQFFLGLTLCAVCLPMHDCLRILPSPMCEMRPNHFSLLTLILTSIFCSAVIRWNCDALLSTVSSVWQAEVAVLCCRAQLIHAVSVWELSCDYVDYVKYVCVFVGYRRRQCLVRRTAVHYQPPIQPVTACIVPAHLRRIYLKPILTPRTTSVRPSRLPRRPYSLATSPPWPVHCRNLEMWDLCPSLQKCVFSHLCVTCLTVCSHRFVEKLPASFAVENNRLWRKTSIKHSWTQTYMNEARNICSHKAEILVFILRDSCIYLLIYHTYLPPSRFLTVFIPHVV